MYFPRHCGRRENEHSCPLRLGKTVLTSVVSQDLSPHADQFRFRDQRAYSGRSATFLGHSLGASSFCVSNQAFKRNLRVRHSRSG
jgi:hypothetical protein